MFGQYIFDYQAYMIKLCDFTWGLKVQMCPKVLFSLGTQLMCSATILFRLKAKYFIKYKGLLKASCFIRDLLKFTLTEVLNSENTM